jgi:Carboxypeptidase regulatory-like domain
MTGRLCALLLMVTAFAGGAQNSTSVAAKDSGEGLGFKIVGTVVNAVTGVALERVTVSLSDTRQPARRIETVTGARGQFEFAGLPVGKYALQGAKRGYITAGYEQHEQYSTAIVTGPEFATDRLVLRLMPMAMIAGHVLDESGDAVRGARVMLFMEDHTGGMSRVQGAGGARSDDRGYFDIGLLQPGIYFVSVTASPWYAVYPPKAQGRAIPRDGFHRCSM